MISQGLQVFIAVAECGSFSKAATRLYVTPAAVMKQINSLEERLGVSLLNRSHQGVKLTEAGNSVYENGKKLLSLAKNMLAEVKNVELNEIIQIRIGSSFLNPGAVLAKLWEPLQCRYPQYRFSLIPFDDASERILSLAAALGEKFDVIIGTLNSWQMFKYCDYLRLGYHNVCIAAPRWHRVARKNLLEIEDLAGETVMMIPAGNTDVLEDCRLALKSAELRITLKDTAYYYDMETFNACERDGCCLLTLDIWANIHPALATLPVKWDFKVPYGILYSRKASQKVRDFIEIMKRHFIQT